MYSVAESTLKTDKGQELVRLHEEEFDVQTIYKELIEYHAKSTKATQNASDLLSYITSHRLGEDSWSGNTESYVVHWKETVRQYHELIPVNQRLVEEQQLVMLQNAIHPVPELRAVKERAESERVLNGTIMTFAQYSTLLQSACQQYDSARRTNTRSRRPAVTRHVYMHEFDDFNNNDDNGQDDLSFDIDTPVDVINAFAAQTKHLASSRMNFKIWNSLSTDEKKLWDQLSDETKALILSGTSGASSTALRSSPVAPSSRGNGFNRQPPRSFRPLNTCIVKNVIVVRMIIIVIIVIMF